MNENIQHMHWQPESCALIYRSGGVRRTPPYHGLFSIGRAPFVCLSLHEAVGRTQLDIILLSPS